MYAHQLTPTPQVQNIASDDIHHVLISSHDYHTYVISLCACRMTYVHIAWLPHHRILHTDHYLCAISVNVPLSGMHSVSAYSICPVFFLSILESRSLSSGQLQYLKRIVLSKGMSLLVPMILIQKWSFKFLINKYNLWKWVNSKE